MLELDATWPVGYLWPFPGQFSCAHAYVFSNEPKCLRDNS